jgi:L-threonylcarbamoyladenylate synthase
VTLEMVRDVLGQAECVPSFTPNEEAKPASPGMKYRHYAPQALLTVVEGNNISVAEAIKYLYDKDIRKGEAPLVLACRENRRYYGKRDVAVMGSAEDLSEVARGLYALLRGADEDGYSRIYFEGIPKSGIGFAVMNRVYKAAAYNIVKV